MSNNINVNKKSKQVQTEYPLVEHLEEIKKRLKYIILILIVLFIAGYSQGEKLVQIIQAPILAALPENEKLNAAFIQSGLNPLNNDELSRFLDSCSNKGVI